MYIVKCKGKLKDSCEYNVYCWKFQLCPGGTKGIVSSVTSQFWKEQKVTASINIFFDTSSCSNKHIEHIYFVDKIKEFTADFFLMFLAKYLLPF